MLQHEKFQSAPGSRVGTPAYLAPEVILTTKGKTYDGKVVPAWLPHLLTFCCPQAHTVHTQSAHTYYSTLCLDSDTMVTTCSCCRQRHVALTGALSGMYVCVLIMWHGLYECVYWQCLALWCIVS